LNYGIHYLVNVVTQAAGDPAAVLIRALEPLDGIPLMMRRRSVAGRTVEVPNLCRGPGNLTKALDITLSENRLDVTRPPDTVDKLYIEDRGVRPRAIASGPRVGIRVGVERAWRFWIAGNPCVSAPRQRVHPP
jgi:DNA-3-methyladenine glycosylase